jgi:hypothetical protein
MASQSLRALAGDHILACQMELGDNQQIYLPIVNQVTPFPSDAK